MSETHPAVQGVLAVTYRTEFILLDERDPMLPGRIAASRASEGWVLCSVTAGHVTRSRRVVVDFGGKKKPPGRVLLSYAVATFCKPPEGWTVALVPKVQRFNDKPAHFHAAVTPNDSLWTWAQPTVAEDASS